MSGKYINAFEIKNFKKFDTLSISNIGKFNLIVGDNNVGKTTLLEALTLTDDVKESAARLIGCLTWRRLSYNKQNSNFLETYFRSPDNQNIWYTYQSGNDRKSFKFSVVNSSILNKEQQDELNLKNIGVSPSPFVIILENLVTNQVSMEYLIHKYNDIGHYMPFIVYNLAWGDDLISFYSDVIQENKKNKLEILRTLQIIIPNIEDIEISSGTNLNNTFLISIKDDDRPKLINSFGDGTIKLFRYILEIFKCSGGRIMIDEIDTGVHYSKMKEFIKSILRLALEKDVQVFATTHSKDCIEHFNTAVHELHLQESSRIIRLSETKYGIKAYTMNYSEFSNSIEAESEIR